MGRAGAAALTKGEVAAQDMEAMLGELLGNGDEQRGGAVGACSVGEDNAGFIGFNERQMQEAVDSVLLNEFRH